MTWLTTMAAAGSHCWLLTIITQYEHSFPAKCVYPWMIFCGSWWLGDGRMAALDSDTWIAHMSGSTCLTLNFSNLYIDIYIYTHIYIIYIYTHSFHSYMDIYYCIMYYCTTHPNQPTVDLQLARSGLAQVHIWRIRTRTESVQTELVHKELHETQRSNILETRSWLIYHINTPD